MATSQINNKRIAKNTVLLYIRTLFVMVISLYTSRVVLQVLGVEDYGIYQVIGGLVAMFSVISASLSSAVSRFITFELGTGDKERLKRIFATSIVIQIVIAFVVFIVAEVIGMWFMQTQMQIPASRMTAAQWVLHCSLITFCINLLSVPYNACIIAHEHMKTFAYVSILNALLTLAVCFIIKFAPFDRLIFYAILLTLTAVIIRLIYTFYCHKHFEESRVKLQFDKPVFKEMFGFAGWSFFTNTNFILNTQGVNMLINVFFGVTFNAARGIANQVEHAVASFVNSFTTAVNPQITKSYASGDKEGMYVLVCRAAKFSFFTMFLIALPIICEADTILHIWLTVVPDKTVIFVQLSLVLGMLDCIGTSGFTACMATGKLKKYSIVISSIGIMEFPLTWIFFLQGASIVSTYWLYIAVKSVVLIARMYLLKSMVGLPVRMYVQKVFIPVITVAALAIIPPIVLINFITPSLIRLLLSVVVGVLSVGTVALFAGMTVNERQLILQKVNSGISRLKK